MVEVVEVKVVAEGVVDVVDEVPVLRLSKHTNQNQNPRKRERYRLEGTQHEDVYHLWEPLQLIRVPRKPDTHE